MPTLGGGTGQIAEIKWPSFANGACTEPTEGEEDCFAFNCVLSGEIEFTNVSTGELWYSTNGGSTRHRVLPTQSAAFAVDEPVACSLTGSTSYELTFWEASSGANKIDDLYLKFTCTQCTG